MRCLQLNYTGIPLPCKHVAGRVSVASLALAVGESSSPQRYVGKSIHGHGEESKYINRPLYYDDRSAQTIIYILQYYGQALCVARRFKWRLNMFAATLTLLHV